MNEREKTDCVSSSSTLPSERIPVIAVLAKGGKKNDKTVYKDRRLKEENHQ